LSDYLPTGDFNEEAYCFGNFDLAVLGSVSSNGSAQKLVDPDKLAPEFRDDRAALIDCNKKKRLRCSQEIKLPTSSLA